MERSFETEMLRSYRICIEHFPDRAFTDAVKKNRLKLEAVPSILMVCLLFISKENYKCSYIFRKLVYQQKCFAENMHCQAP